MQVLFDVHQAFTLAFQEASGGYAGPFRDQLGYVQLTHHHVRAAVSLEVFALDFIFLGQTQPFKPKLSSSLIVGALRCSVFLIEQLLDPFFDVLDIGWEAFRVDAQAAGRLVDEVHRLVGKLTPSDVAVTEAGGGNQSGVVDIHLVMGLITGPQDPQDLHRFFHRWLLKNHRLKTAL